MAFPPLGNSGYVDVSVSIDFPTNSKWDALFHSIAYDYSRADWESLHDFVRCSLRGIFKLSASAAASEFYKWVQVGIDVYIPHCKYQVNLTHLYGFQLLVLLPSSLKSLFLSVSINLLNLE